MSEKPQKSASNGSEFDCAGDQVPLNYFNWIPEREQTRRDVYRPVYSIHKWFARRSGMLFRALEIACLSDETLEPEDILQMGESENEWSGYYLHPEELESIKEKRVLDPFMGGGTTIAECARLGVPVIGKEINPVAWWITKKETDPADMDVLREAKESLLSHLREEFGEFYQASCPVCEKENGGQADKEWWEAEDREDQAESLYYLLAMKVPCSKCGEDTRVFDNFHLEKDTDGGVVYCPTCEEPREHSESWGRWDDKIFTCPVCDTTFDVDNSSYGGGVYKCQNEGCGNESDIKVAIQEAGGPPNFEPFVVQIKCSKHGKLFRKIDDSDLDTISKATEELERRDLPLPEQSIDSGHKTDALLNYNYEDWADLFTDRQLLIFGEAMRYAMENYDQNTAEYLITAVSSCLEFNSLLCPFQASQLKGINVFKEHGFDVKISPCEPNPLTTAGTQSSFPNALDKVIRGKSYMVEEPFEKIPRPSGGTARIDLNTSYEPGELDLRTGTSEVLDIEEDSIDYIITDPPYSHNVQYSELSDYFYVWLKAALDDEYEEFEGETTPKLNEIVVNPHANKDTDFFLNGLNNVFGRCRDLLAEDGAMVFTYHHTQSIGWQPILESILENDFVITGTYPVASESLANVHIGELDNTSYDILIFTEPRPPSYDPDPISLNRLKRRVHQAAKPLVEENREQYRSLSLQDVAVIVRGKLLQIYSQHYPEIYDGEEPIHDVGKILEIFDDEIEKYLVDTTPLPEGADAYTEAYAYLAGHEPLEHDELNKWLMTKGVSYGELEERQLVDGSQDARRTVDPVDRFDYLDNRVTDPRNHEELSQIDKLHYLYARFDLDKETFSYANVWEDRLLQDIADSLEEVTGDEMYTKVLETGFDKFEFE